jgi:2-polyprenyl-6-methoxyphenol hydroxylase-like FAD-dependent oxidoreductase
MRSAVVVGAGIGGLAMAGALTQTGWQVTLLERDDRIRPGRAALVLWPNGVRALQALGLNRGLDAIATPVPGTPGAVVVHREDLHDVFIAGLSERADVRTGTLVRTARPAGHRPAVSDGRTLFEADLVVAADGADSVIRKRLAPAVRFTSAGSAAWQAVIPWFRAPAVASFGSFFASGHRFFSASLGERGSSGGSTRGGIYWSATAPGARRPEPPATQLGLLRRWFSGWDPAIGALLAATEPDDLVHEPVGQLDPFPGTFTRDGYVLLGDAAHAMAHHLEQGACLALEDAATLQTLLMNRRLDDALAEYERVRRPRALRLLALTRRAGAALAAGTGRLRPRSRSAARVLERAQTDASTWAP